MTDAQRLKALSTRVARLTDQRNELAAERAMLARSLSADGWSLSQIAAAAGVKKATVQGWLA